MFLHIFATVCLYGAFLGLFLIADQCCFGRFFQTRRRFLPRPSPRIVRDTQTSRGLSLYVGVFSLISLTSYFLADVLTKHQISIRFAVFLQSLLLLYLLGKFLFRSRGTRAWVIPFVFSCSLSMLALFSKSWVVLDIIGGLICVSALMIGRNIPLRIALVITVTYALVIDIPGVFGSSLMESVADEIIGTPMVFIAPATLLPMTYNITLLGLPDIILSGGLVMVAFRESRARSMPIFAIGALIGYIGGLLLGAEMAHVFQKSQPMMPYLVTTITGSISIVSWYYHVPFTQLLYHTNTLD